MKKYCAIFAVLALFVLLYCLESKWYHRGESINIIGNYQLFSNTGKIESDGQVKGTGGKEGFVVFGPYMQLKEGKYEVAFKLFLENPNAGENPSKIVGYCDVAIADHPEKSKHADLVIGDFIKNNPKEIKVRFSVPGGSPKIEYRVFQYGGNSISLTSLRVYAKSFRLRADDLKGQFMRKNIILFALILLFSIAGYHYRVKKREHKPIKYDLLDEKDVTGSVPISFMFQFCIVAYFALLIFNAYFFNKLNIDIGPFTEALAVITELIIFFLVFKKYVLKLPSIKYDLWDSVLFGFSFGFTFFVLILPSLPTFMPINYSNDCVLHYNWVEYLYNNKKLTGSILSSYPFGYHLITVILSKYMGVPAVKMMHILLVFSVSMSTAIVYAIILRIFNLRKDGKLMALLPVFTLFLVRGYYERSFNGLFHGPMVFSYLFMMSFLWAMVEYKNNPKWLSHIALNLSAIGMLYTYTFHLPVMLIAFIIYILMGNKEKYSARLKDMLIVIMPSLILLVIHALTKNTAKIGLEVLSANGWCVPFRFFNFGSFGDNHIGGKFLILSLLGLPFVFYKFRRNIAINSFFAGFSLYLGMFLIMVYYYGKLSPYPISKMLYYYPYLGVIFIAALINFIREKYLKIYYPAIGHKIYNLLSLFWIVLILLFMGAIYKYQNYKPDHVEILKEPVFMAIDWARGNVKEKFDCIYHHKNIGNWMYQGFLGETFGDALYYKVFTKPLPTLENWLNNAKSGEIAVVDDLNDPPLSEIQMKQFEIIYQREYSAVIRTK